MSQHTEIAIYLGAFAKNHHHAGGSVGMPEDAVRYWAVPTAATRRKNTDHRIVFSERNITQAGIIHWHAALGSGVCINLGCCAIERRRYCQNAAAPAGPAEMPPSLHRQLFPPGPTDDAIVLFRLGGC